MTKNLMTSPEVYLLADWGRNTLDIRVELAFAFGNISIKVTRLGPFVQV